jgi:hypothetical protein
MKVEPLMKNNRQLAMNTNKSDSLHIQTEGWIVTVQYLQGFNIYVITELTIATLFALVLVMRYQMSCCRFLCFTSRLTCGLLKNHRTPKQLYCFMPNTPVQCQSSSLIAMIVSWEYTGDYGFLLCKLRGGGHLGRVHPDQMVLEMIRRGSLVR